ncbi:hypothetical protein [Synechococcus elongatus]|uniref:PulJ/GspJ family protein n=1 Tax=Synechococcus elongatus TaxID=32046 RepID=UPI0030CD3F8F
MNTFHSSSTQGLTLAEVLIGVVIAGIVIGGSGYGLAAITAANRTEEARVDRRMEMSRALEFVSDEIKSARGIARDPASVIATQAPDFTLPSGAQILLAISSSKASQSIIYYLAAPPANSVWQGPQVLYRWGPSFDAAGNYSNPNLPREWTYSPLLDLVANTASPDAENCRTTGVAADQVQIPTNNANRRGLFVCLDDIDRNQGRLASLQLSSEINKVIGGNERLDLSTQAFARNIISGSSGAGLPPGLLDPSGDLIVPDDVGLRFQVLGGAMQCGNGSNIDVATKLFLTAPGATTVQERPLDPNNPLNLDPGTVERVTVESIARGGSCGFSGPRVSTGPNSARPNDFLVLKNGDSVPSGYVPYNNQAQIDAFLRPVLGPDGRIRIRDNQLIYLFELAGGRPGQSTFDMQDNVVLVTVNPEQVAETP